jgi:hypothetical protein
MAGIEHSEDATRRRYDETLPQCAVPIQAGSPIQILSDHLMPRFDLSFLILATLSLLMGVLLGIWMGVVHDFQFAAVHVHLSFLGWTSLAVFGLCYRSYPELAHSRMAMLHFVLASSSGILFPLGISLSIVGFTQTLAIICAFIWLASVVLFLANLVRIALAGPVRPLRTSLSSLGASSPAPGVVGGFSQWRESL